MLIGVATRTAALGLAILMSVAIACVHWATGGAGWLAVDRE